MTGVIFLAIIAFIVIRVLKSTARRGSEFDRVSRRALAHDRRSRRVQPGPRKIFEGVVEGYPVLVERIGNPVSSTALQTRYSVSYPPLGLGLHLRLHRNGDERDDIQVGDPAFDRTHLVIGGIPSQVRAFLSETRRARIHRVLAAYPGTRITDSGIVLVRPRADTDPRAIKAVLRDFVYLAKELHREPDSADPFAAAIEARREGRVEQAVELGREAVQRDDDVDPSALVLVGESLVVAQRHEEAHTAFEAALEELPDDEEIVVLAAQMRARLDRPPTGKKPAPDPEPVAPPPLPKEPSGGEPSGESSSEPAAAPSALDAASVCEHLFAENRPSYDTTAIFDDGYTGRRVRWSGTLHSVSSFYSDMVFGDGPGLKATLDLGDLEGYSGRAARVVVALAKDAEADLRAARGKPIAVEGVLHRCDAFMRVFYLADGSFEVL